MIGILVIPIAISILLSILTLVPVSISVPNEVQLIEAIIGLNGIFILSSLYPAIKLSRNKILNPLTREI